MTQVAIIDNGGGNAQSVKLALDRLGVASVHTADAAIIQGAGHVILPGVGSAPDSMQRLVDSGLDRLIPTLARPVLGICLGMQLLFEYSAEGEVACLGILSGAVKRLIADAAHPVPHMGWTRVHWTAPSPLFAGLESGSYAYYAHSYAAAAGPCACATSDHPAPFAAAVSHRNFHGVQFHPERSGAIGARILMNFLAIGG